MEEVGHMNVWFLRLTERIHSGSERLFLCHNNLIRIMARAR
jgi:hypothetical protein